MQLLKRTVFLDLEPYKALDEPLRDVRVALFSGSSDNEEDSYSSDVVLHVGAGLAHTRKLLDREMADAWIALGVRSVFCQRSIPKPMQSYLAYRGVLTVQRLGTRHTRTLNSLLFINLCPKINSVIYSYHGETPFSTKEASAMRGIKSQLNFSFFLLC